MAKKRAGTAVPEVSAAVKHLMENSIDPSNVYGLPVPSIAFSYMMDCNYLPVGKVIGIAGPSQSQKSSLGFEISNWVINSYGGYGHLAENEGKHSPSLIQSLIGEDVFSKKFFVTFSEDLQDTQSRITRTVESIRKRKERDELWAIVLDSLAGPQSEGDAQQVAKDGFAESGYPLEAKLWTRYLRYLVAAINTYPIVFISINHLKDKMATRPGMPAGKTTPGGVAQRFHSSIYFWVRRVSQREDALTRETWEIPSVVDGQVVSTVQPLPINIRRINIECEKNSMGVDKREIEVDFCFFQDTYGNPRSFFDWDGATARFLVDKQKTSGSIGTAEGNSYGKLSALLKVECDKNRYYCPEFGLEDVAANVVGYAIRQRPDWVAKLELFFGVKKLKRWEGRLPIPLQDPIVSPPETDGDEKVAE